MNKIILVALLAIAICKITEKQTFDEFQKFTQKYNKKYSNLQEYMARYRIFAKNYKRVMYRNKKYQGVTKFMDMTRDEFRRKHLNLDMTVLDTLKPSKKVQVKDSPESYDWREQGACNAIKDQASCGSCWAFSNNANLEGQYYIKYKESMTFSEQQLVDCDTIDSGCNGGLMENSFKWIKDNGGLESDEDYPYVGYDDTCHQDKSKFKVTVTNWKLYTEKDEDYIKDWLYTTGPLSIGFNADSLQWYTGGIDDSDFWECDPDGFNHGVALVGYGVEGGVKYWIGRNSWGTSWGEDGYFRMTRGKNTCGIAQYVISAEVEKV